MYFSPASGSYDVGKTFSVGVYITSSDKAMNAAEGSIKFPADKLEVVSLSKSGSFFSLWVQEPTFSNSVGTVNFEGIVLNPGFTGSGAKALVINFKAKAVADASVAFISGSILANDGNGTNILTGMGSATFRLNTPPVGQPAPESTTPAEPAGVPAAPKVVSSTHPDPNKWYAGNDPKFEWVMGKDVTGVSILIDNKPNSNPGTRPDGVFSSYQYENIADGASYFHIRLKNASGWGGISHFLFQIDTEKPISFDIKEIVRADLTEPTVKFIFTAEDKISGIDHYEVQINNEEALIWRDDGSHQYETPVMRPGKHTLLAKAVDKGGNTLAASADFTVQPLSTPVFTEYPTTMRVDEALLLRGTTRSNAQIIIWLKKDKDEAIKRIVPADQDGKFIFIADEKLKEGIYKLWAEAVDARGAMSNPTEKLTIIVRPSTILLLGSQMVTILAVIVPLISLLIILLALIWYAWHRFSVFRKQVLKETREAEGVLHKAIDMLKDDIVKQVKLLEKAKTKRDLTKEEDKIIKQFKKDLDSAEAIVEKEIEDIKKGLE